MLFEFSFALLVHREIVTLSRKFGWNKVKCILLKAGMMNAINPQLVAASFEHVSKGTVTEGARLLVMTTPLVMRCKHCGKEAYSEERLYLCPNCGHEELEMHSGLEFCIELLEVERRG